MRGIPGLGQRCNGNIDWRGLLGGTYTRSSNSNLDNFDLLTQVQCLTNPANTGAAMHSIDPKRKLCQFCPRLSLMIRPQRRCRALNNHASRLLLDETCPA